MIIARHKKSEKRSADTASATCSDGVVERTTTRVPFHYKKEIIYVDHVPVRMRRKCGEIYFEAEVYKALEKIAEHTRESKAKITFPLADYRMAEALEAE